MRSPRPHPSLTGVVVVEPKRQPEAIAQGRRQQACASRSADHRERWEIERKRARCGALPHHNVDAEVLERGIKNLLRRAAHPVDLVDEEHIARLERGEDRCDVLLLDRRARDRANAHAKFFADDVREARLA